MNSRVEIINEFYQQINEDNRLTNTRRGQLEYAVTLHYIQRFAEPGAKVLEVGAGTGRYSIALAKAGMQVHAVELLDTNLKVIKEKAAGVNDLIPLQGDATDLSDFADNSFDVTLILGPLYHIYETKDVHKALDEAIRVTKNGGVILVAFISVYAIMYANYFDGTWVKGQEENFTADFRTKHFKEQLFTGYDISEFEALFADKPVDWVITTGVDGPLELIETHPKFKLSDSDFQKFLEWYLAFSEKRELLGMTNHLLYIAKKK